MSCLDYAKYELELLEKKCKDVDDLEVQKWVTKSVLDLLKVFSDQDHSGFSASYIVNLFDALVDFRPLTPLTGEDDEWCEIGNGDYQNKRCGRVFKNADGRVYDINYWYMVDELCGFSYGSSECFQDIVFPYMPKKSKKLGIRQHITSDTIKQIKESELAELKKEAERIKTEE